MPVLWAIYFKLLSGIHINSKQPDYQNNDPVSLRRSAATEAISHWEIYCPQTGDCFGLTPSQGHRICTFSFSRIDVKKEAPAMRGLWLHCSGVNEATMLEQCNQPGRHRRIGWCRNNLRTRRTNLDRSQRLYRLQKSPRPDKLARKLHKKCSPLRFSLPWQILSFLNS